MIAAGDVQVLGNYVCYCCTCPLREFQLLCLLLICGEALRSCPFYYNILSWTRKEKTIGGKGMRTATDKITKFQSAYKWKYSQVSNDHSTAYYFELFQNVKNFQLVTTKKRLPERVNHLLLRVSKFRGGFQ